MAERWRSGLALLASLLVLGAVIVAAPGSELDGLRRALGFDSDPLGSPADVAPGGTYAFLEHQPGAPDDPVAWEPCRAIRYEVNPHGAPDDPEEAVAFVAEAVAEISAVTGLQFDYVGRTDRRPAWKREFVPVGRTEPVLVAWATEDEVDELDGDVAGVGGAVAVSDGQHDWLRYVTGAVTLDEEVFDRLEGERDGARYQRAILLHELGHVVGLGHVDSPAELMFPDNVGQLGFGQGDLNGLVRLGKGRCR